MKTNRFTDENIKKTVHISTDTPKKEWIKRNILPIIMDFFSFYLTVFWIVLFNLTDFSSTLFFTGFILLQILNIYIIYLIFIKFYTFKVNEFNIYSDKIKSPVKIVFVSDIHVGTVFAATNSIRLRRIVNKINSIQKDIVLLGGDFLTHNLDLNLLPELKNLKGERTSVYGNHDVYYRQSTNEPIKYDYPTEFINALENVNIPILLNESKIFNLNDQNILVGGIPDLFDLNFDLDKTFEGQNDENFRILLSHNPDIWEFITDEDEIDLVLSGHLHSGQIHSNLTGPILPIPSKYRHHTKGLYKIGKKTALLISQGIGYSITRFKVGVENEIMVINLLPQST